QPLGGVRRQAICAKVDDATPLRANILTYARVLDVAEGRDIIDGRNWREHHHPGMRSRQGRTGRAPLLGRPCRAGALDHRRRIAAVPRGRRRGR
ncbi:MAG TPA: hypothetical protein PJ982_07415, partial [Lacipirellulaceae bacterium]|nr:hypothetical protein [Lacipirellulaceae bacterium]